jgi:hypothetical protein
MIGHLRVRRLCASLAALLLCPIDVWGRHLQQDTAKRTRVSSVEQFRQAIENQVPRIHFVANVTTTLEAFPGAVTLPACGPPAGDCVMATIQPRAYAF